MIELNVYWIQYDEEAKEIQENLNIKMDIEEETLTRPMTFLNIDNFYAYMGTDPDICKKPATVVITSNREYIAAIHYEDLKILIAKF